MKTRIPYERFHSCLRDTDDLVLRRPGGKEKVVKSGKWWINRNTPVGDPVEYYERKPHDGYREFYPKEIIAIERDE